MVINESDLKYKDCISQLEFSNGKYCKIILTNDFRSSKKTFTRKQSIKIYHNYQNSFKKLLNSKQRINFSSQLLNYLSDKKIIKPFLFIHSVGSGEIIATIVVASLNHAGEGLKLSA